MEYNCGICSSTFDTKISLRLHQSHHKHIEEEIGPDLLTNFLESTKKLLETTTIKVQDKFINSQKAIADAIKNFDLNENSVDLVPSNLTDSQFNYFMGLPERTRMGDLHEWITSTHYQLDSKICHISECTLELGLQNGKINCQKLVKINKMWKFSLLVAFKVSNEAHGRCKV